MAHGNGSVPYSQESSTKSKWFLWGTLNGVYQEFYEDGSIKTIGAFVDDQREGSFKSYNKEGGLISEKIYEKGEKKLGKSYDGYGNLILTPTN